LAKKKICSPIQQLIFDFLSVILFGFSRRTQEAKVVTLDLEDVKVLTILSDQGPIGLGMASYIAFCGCHLVHFTFDVFHRLIRDLKLDVQGVGPKYLRQKLLHAQLCSSYLWTLNYRPYGSGGFAAAKEELVEHFLQSETQDQTILKILGSVSRLLRQLWSVKYMFVVHEQVTTAGISNYIKCIWEALVFPSLIVVRAVSCSMITQGSLALIKTWRSKTM
jgi:hypothetical protein